MSLKNEAITRAIALLNASGAKYKVITADGQEFGELVVEKAKTKKWTKDTRFVHGERTAYIRAYLERMKTGDEVTIPWGPYGEDGLAGVVAPTCLDAWGKGGYITETAADGVKVLKVA